MSTNDMGAPKNRTYVTWLYVRRAMKPSLHMYFVLDLLTYFYLFIDLPMLFLDLVTLPRGQATTILRERRKMPYLHLVEK